MFLIIIKNFNEKEENFCYNKHRYLTGILLFENRAADYKGEGFKCHLQQMKFRCQKGWRNMLS